MSRNLDSLPDSAKEVAMIGMAEYYLVIRGDALVWGDIPFLYSGIPKS